MVMDLFRSVVSLGTKFFVPSPPMDISQFFIPFIVEPLGFRTWCEGMRGVCLSQDNVKNFTIDKIVWAKEDDIIGHEYLVFRVRISVPSHTVLLKLERTTESEMIKGIIDNEDPIGTLFGENEDNTIDEASKRLVAPEVKRLLGAKFRELQAKEGKLNRSPSECDDYPRKSRNIAFDKVSHIPDDYLSTCKDTLLFTYKFKQPDALPLTIRDLAIIANTMHCSCEREDWKSRNCYWFARTMKDIIMKIAKPSEHPQKGKDQAGRAGCNFVLKWSLQKSIQNKDSDIEALVNQINRSIEEDDKRIRDISEKDERHAREMEALRREIEVLRREKEAIDTMTEELLRRNAKYEAEPSTIPMAQSVAA